MDLIDRIRELAHSYWEEEGRPENHDLDHWLRAEAELLAPSPITTDQNAPGG